MADVQTTLRRAHLASMAAMLRAERESLAEIARAALASVTGFLRDLSDVQGAAYRLEASLVEPIRRAQQRGREASLVTIDREWETVRRRVIQEGANPFAVPLKLRSQRQAQDAVAAIAAARSIAGLFAKGAAAAVTAADGRSVSGRSVLPVYAIEETAATQTAVAFNVQRVEVEQQLVQDQRGAEWLPLVGKMWDATLDRKTCPVCREMDGQIRLLGLSFDRFLTPASVHPRCRCVQVLIFAPLYMGREDQQAA